MTTAHRWDALDELTLTPNLSANRSYNAKRRFSQAHNHSHTPSYTYSPNRGAWHTNKPRAVQVRLTPRFSCQHGTKYYRPTATCAAPRNQRAEPAFEFDIPTWSERGCRVVCLRSNQQIPRPKSRIRAVREFFLGWREWAPRPHSEGGDTQYLWPAGHAEVESRRVAATFQIFGLLL